MGDWLAENWGLYFSLLCINVLVAWSKYHDQLYLQGKRKSPFFNIGGFTSCRRENTPKTAPKTAAPGDNPFGASPKRWEACMHELSRYTHDRNVSKNLLYSLSGRCKTVEEACSLAIEQLVRDRQ